MDKDWRALLDEASAHWAHIHVAHQGGVIDSVWPNEPNPAPNEE